MEYEPQTSFAAISLSTLSCSEAVFHWPTTRRRFPALFLTVGEGDALDVGQENNELGHDGKADLESDLLSAFWNGATIRGRNNQSHSEK